MIVDCVRNIVLIKLLGRIGFNAQNAPDALDIPYLWLNAPDAMINTQSRLTCI